MHTDQKQPETQVPPIECSVDIPLTAATIFGVEDRKYTLVTLEVYGKFNDLAKDQQTIGDEFFRRCEGMQCPALTVVSCMHVQSRILTN